MSGAPSAIRIVFLLPVASQPRFAKRISSLIAEGATAEALAFEREYPPGNPLPCSVTPLGWIPHERYLARLGTYLRALPRIRAATTGAIVYAFGLDLLLLAWLANCARRRAASLVYEIGDVRKILTSEGLLPALLRALERFLCRRCRVVVTTAPGFVSNYFHARQKLQSVPFVVIENKLPDTFAPFLERRQIDRSSGPIRIGYFGLLPCRRSWEVLRLAVQRSGGRIEVLARGKPSWDNALRVDVAGTPGLSFGGPYVSPDGLPEIYSSVDVVWTAHHIEEDNGRWAISNRYYEASAFGKPQVGQAGTGDGELIAALGLGPIVDLDNPAAAVELILQIDWPHIERWRETVSRVPQSLYRYTGEHRELLARIASADPAVAPCL